MISEKDRKTLVDGGITGGDLAGIIIGWMFGLPALFGLVIIIFILVILKIHCFPFYLGLFLGI